MSFESLLRERVIERVTASPREIAALVDVARRDTRTAQALTATDLDWAFVIAYNAVLQLSIAYMYSLGFRPRNESKHYNTFRFISEALPEDAGQVRRLQSIRRKRNVVLYEQAGVVSEKEAREVIEFSLRYYEETVGRLPANVRPLIDRSDS